MQSETVRVDVRWFDLADLTESLELRLRAVVGPEVLAKADRLRRDTDRQGRIVGHAMARYAVSERIGHPPADLLLRRRCPQCGPGDHGKPSFDTRDGTSAVEVSISHSGSLVGLAVAAVPVGIDLESGQRQVDWAAVEPLVRHRDEPSGLTPAESVRRWTRKEAALKATGDGLTVPMTSFRVAATGPAGWSTVLPGERHIAGADLELPVSELPPVPAAVAVCGMTALQQVRPVISRRGTDDW